MNEIIEGEVIEPVEIAEVIEHDEVLVPEPKPEEEKVPKGAQRRIDQVTREKHEARRELERERAERAALAIELERLKSNQPAPEVKTLPNGAPDPNKYAAGRYDPDYLEAVTDYKVQQVIQQQHAQQSAGEKQRYIVSKENEARESYPDFDDAASAFLSHPLARVQEFRDILIDTENPAELSYYLGKNPDELEKISSMTASQATRYIGKLEARLEATPLEKPKKAATSAPAPITPLGSARSSTVATKDPAKMTMDEYAAYRKAQK